MICKSTNKQGKPCKAKPMANGYCFRHNPETIQERKIASYNGGKGNNHNICEIEAIEVNSILDIPKYLVNLINAIIQGKADIKTTNAIGYLTGHLIKAFVEGEQAKQIQDILARLDEIEKTKL